MRYEEDLREIERQHYTYEEKGMMLTNDTYEIDRLQIMRDKNYFMDTMSKLPRMRYERNEEDIREIERQHYTYMRNE